jgi:UDP-galactopyranose mutase
MAGFESACQINRHGRRLDMIAAVQHDSEAEQDYGLIRGLGFRSARDGVRWHLVDRGSHYDFSSLQPLANAAQRHGVQVIWNLLHYGWPEDLDVFSSQFVDRFAKFAGAVAKFFADRSDAIPFYAPVNEISFLSWAGSRGLMYPFAHGRDAELKRQLVRAAIAACEAIWIVDKRARFVYPEPTIHCVPLPAQPTCIQPADAQNESQFEAWDMIAGYNSPELGGDPKYLDILGSNFYHSNQWECPDGERIHWHIKPRDSRWVPLHRLLQAIHQRYERPIFVAETSHVGVGRAEWIVEVAEQVRIAKESGVPIEGICLYPILDRYDWDDSDHWHNSGLWDLQLTEDGQYERVLNEAYMDGLHKAGDILRHPIGRNIEAVALPSCLT